REVLADGEDVRLLLGRGPRGRPRREVALVDPEQGRRRARARLLLEPLALPLAEADDRRRGTERGGERRAARARAPLPDRAQTVVDDDDARPAARAGGEREEAGERRERDLGVAELPGQR